MPEPPPPEDFSGKTERDDTPLQVLLVEDNPGDARLFEEYLAEGPVEAHLRHEETLEACLTALGEEEPDVLVADLGLPDSAGTETVKAAATTAPKVPIVVLTGQDDLQAALEAQEAGATEYLQKDELSSALVGRTLRWALQQRRMQAKLRQRDIWIQSITEGLSAGVFRTGPTGHIEYANEALAEMLGFETEEELIGRDLTTFYATPADRGRMLVEEGVDAVEIKFEGLGGSTFVGLLSAKAAYDPNGKVLRYDGTVTDITKRAQRKKDLRMLSKAVEQSKEAILITEATPLDEPGPRVEYVNAAFEKMTGYSAEEMIGETPRILQGPETDREVLNSLRAALEAGQEWQGETVNYGKDGESYQVQWNVAPVRGEDGDIEHWVSVQRDVTEERRREEQLQRQNDLFQKAQELASVGAWEYDRQTETLTLTSEAYRAYGLDPGSDAVPERVHGLYHPEDRAEVEEAFRRALEEGRPYDIEARLTTLTGEERWARTSGEAQTEDGEGPGGEGSGGEVTRIRGAVQNITQRKRREEELRQKTAQLEALFDQSPDMINVHDPGGSILLPNVRLCEQTGYSEEELVGMKIWDLDVSVGPEEARELRAGMTVGDERRFEGRYRRKDDSTFPVEVHLRCLDLEGEERLIGISHDITERKRGEQTLRDRQQKLRALYSATDRLLRATDRMEVGNVILDLINNKLGYTGSTVRFAENGVLKPSCVSGGALDLMGERPAFDIEGDSAMAQVYQAGESVVLDDVRALDNSVDYGTTRAGAAFPLGTHGVVGIAAAEVGAIDEFNAHLVEVVASHATAVLDSIEQLEELREAKEEAERMNRLKSAFLANMSHEIRTPLTSILGFSEAIGEEVGDPEDTGEVDLPALAHFSSLIEKSGRRLMDTLTSVLDLSKLQAGEMDLRLGPVNLVKEVEEAAEAFGPQAKKAGIDLKTEVGGEPVWARADEGGLGIVLRNLLSNAIKYTEEGGTVRASARREKNGAVVEVEDSGIGMDPKKTQGLFEAFKQESEGIGREYEGSGLGLTVTKEVLDQMGGSIEVETEKGEGSRFTVRLPLSNNSGEA